MEGEDENVNGDHNNKVRNRNNRNNEDKNNENQNSQDFPKCDSDLAFVTETTINISPDEHDLYPPAPVGSSSKTLKEDTLALILNTSTEHAKFSPDSSSTTMSGQINPSAIHSVSEEIISSRDLNLGSDVPPCWFFLTRSTGHGKDSPGSTISGWTNPVSLHGSESAINNSSDEQFHHSPAPHGSSSSFAEENTSPFSLKNDYGFPLPQAKPSGAHNQPYVANLGCKHDNTEPSASSPIITSTINPTPEADYVNTSIPQSSSNMEQTHDSLATKSAPGTSPSTSFPHHEQT